LISSIRQSDLIGCLPLQQLPCYVRCRTEESIVIAYYKKVLKGISVLDQSIRPLLLVIDNPTGESACP